MQKKISIIVPVFNVSEYIDECLASIATQDYENLEVIFVDDCGTDDSIAKIESSEFFKAHDNWKIIRHEHNKGLSGARNTGLREATGEYVYFLDSDDTISNDCISSLAKELEKEPYEMVVGNYKASNGDESMLQIGDIALKDEDVLHTYAEGKWYVMAWNKLCDRKFLIDNDLFFEEGLNHEDVIWTFKLACKARNIYISSAETYYYRVRQSSIMTSMSIEKDLNLYLKVFDKIREFIISESLTTNKDVYTIFEGKRCGIMYSLLFLEEYGLFNDVYEKFHKQNYINPIEAYRNNTIGISQLARDFHYVFGPVVGRTYKKLFYNLLYKYIGKSLSGILWRKSK